MSHRLEFARAPAKNNKTNLTLPKRKHKSNDKREREVEMEIDREKERKIKYNSLCAMCVFLNELEI